MYYIQLGNWYTPEYDTNCAAGRTIPTINNWIACIPANVVSICPASVVSICQNRLRTHFCIQTFNTFNGSQKDSEKFTLYSLLLKETQIHVPVFNSELHNGNMLFSKIIVNFPQRTRQSRTGPFAIPINFTTKCTRNCYVIMLHSIVLARCWNTEHNSKIDVRLYFHCFKGNFRHLGQTLTINQSNAHPTPKKSQHPPKTHDFRRDILCHIFILCCWRASRTSLSRMHM